MLLESVRSDHPVECLLISVEDTIQPIDHGLHGLELETGGSSTEVAAVAGRRSIRKNSGNSRDEVVVCNSIGVSNIRSCTIRRADYLG